MLIQHSRGSLIGNLIGARLRGTMRERLDRTYSGAEVLCGC